MFVDYVVKIEVTVNLLDVSTCTVIQQIDTGILTGQGLLPF